MPSLHPPACDNLLLLVGTNPLPNYVAARLLARPGGTIYLLYTYGTFHIAERLREQLQMAGDAEEAAPATILREVHDADDVKIAKVVAQICAAIRQSNPAAQIHLHYTGGTKPMAVHAYKTVLAAFPDADFSYLDPRLLALRIDSLQAKGERIYPLLTDPVLRRRVHLGLADLAALHSHDLVRSSTPHADSELPAALARIYADRDSYGEWKTWLSFGNCPPGELRTTAGWLDCFQALDGTFSDSPRKLDRWRKWLQGLPPLTKLPDPDLYPGLDPLQAAVARLRPALDLPPDAAPEQVVCRHLGQESLAACRKWLNGGWLEDYVQTSVARVAQPEAGISSEGMQCEFVRIPQDKDRQGAPPTARDFELDGAAMVGHQLHAISCAASDDKGYCKNHLFEAFVRARQLGGDEARAALVCLVENVSALEEEVRRSWEAEEKIKIFGRADLADLPQKLATWILRETKTRSGSVRT